MADSPGGWENRCQVVIDPQGKAVCRSTRGTEASSRDLTIKYDARDQVQLPASTAGSDFEAGETRVILHVAVRISEAGSHFDSQLAAHLALANAKGWNQLLRGGDPAEYLALAVEAEPDAGRGKVHLRFRHRVRLEAMGVGRVLHRAGLERSRNDDRGLPERLLEPDDLRGECAVLSDLERACLKRAGRGAELTERVREAFGFHPEDTSGTGSTYPPP
jgi:hypothetical protein